MTRLTRTVMGAASVGAALVLGFGAPAFAVPGSGANGDCGSYCPTPSGPSMNGNEANGNRPMAGSVGNADHKNPPGQFKDGSDRNQGYECDGNQGIGQSNPAHTGCEPPSDPS